MKAAFGIAINLFFLGTAAAAEPLSSSAVIVIDGTAQMGAKLGAQRKIDIVKARLPEALVKLGASRTVALWGYGTNPTRKCADSAQLVSPQSAQTSVSSIGEALGSLEPKAGRTPAMATISAALKATPDAETKTSAVVLVAGAGDDCGGDICASARALRAIYPQTKLSVIGVGMAKPAADAFVCASKALGGEFIAVKSTAEFDRALRQALELQDPSEQGAKPPVTPPAKNQTAAVKPSPTVTAPAPVTPQPEAVVTPEKVLPPAAVVEPNVVLTAALASGTPQLESGVTWRISKITATATGQDRIADSPVWASGGGPAKVKLGDGRYNVDVIYGFATGKSEITVTGSKLEKSIDLNGGTIAVQGLQVTKGQPAQDVLYTLHRRESSGSPVEIARSSAEPALFHVNAGDYTIAAAAGLAKIETQVTVLPGKISSVIMALNVGILDLKAFAVDGSPKLIPAWHRLYAASQTSPSPAPLMIIEGPAKRVQLAAGTYRLETMYGQAREVTNVTVNAGQVTSQSIVLNAGEAKVQSASQAIPAAGVNAANPNIPAANLICSIFAVGGNANSPSGRAVGRDPSFIVKAGSYNVQCRKAGGGPTLAKTAEVRVVAGETQTVTLAD